MKKITFLLFLTLNIGLVSAQSYTTPNNGTSYDLDGILNLSASTLNYDGTAYSLSEDLTIASTDTLNISTPETLNIAADIRITIEGTLIFDAGTDQIVIQAVDETAPYDGFRFEEDSEAFIHNTSITYGGGLKVITPNFTLTESFLSNNVSGVSTGAVVSLSNGSPLIQGNTFTFNDLPAVSSGANQSVSATITGNFLEANGQANQNRPQINMGTTGADTLRITNNTILGDVSLDQVGGIAVSNFTGGEILAIIDGNIITDNRYGMTIAGGNAFVYIRNNTITQNNTQNLPNLGGSGISLNSTTDTQNIIARGNYIANNLWGITLLGEASIDLGTNEITDQGNNLFSENGNNGGTFSLYNNTPNTIQAVWNCWEEGVLFSSAEEVEPYIFHLTDDATLGEVIFNPFDCADLSVSSNQALQVIVYPNPSRGSFSFENTQDFTQMSIYTIAGKKVKTIDLQANDNQVNTQLASGIYLLQFKKGNQHAFEKLVIE
ncbi:T9SS type A sorting domain-containing protein [Mesonia sp. MT50]|uniref:T9SS type A sorting domain-containing protein n=1 Tax=Mesonia profundi TaxID=3070998 RepID=A0ABU1A2Q2_9FLAO|nr:T9SS type A sorting domain-containing protein [Mesonia profundi]MDQ7917909.1 T9SS type A sorting domain-containing protein [Mesonia profundi]